MPPAITLTAVSAPDSLLVLPRLAVSTELSPMGIEVMAAVLHIVYAHTANPVRGGSAEHHRAAVDYILAHARGCAVERDGADAATATYTISHPYRPAPLRVRVLLGRMGRACLEMMTPSGAWAALDPSTIRVVFPQDG
jgi:hypothetical protein